MALWPALSGVMDTVERFWKYVQRGNPDECWPWKGEVDKRGGYGVFWTKERKYKAHRYAYEATYGFPEKLHVLHHCDNPPCCNPAHLFLGTIADNNADMRHKLRHTFGEHHHQARLTEGQVMEIRKLAFDGQHDDKAIGEMFGICSSKITAIVNGRRWAHLPLLGRIFHCPFCGAVLPTGRTRMLASKYGHCIQCKSKEGR